MIRVLRALFNIHERLTALEQKVTDMATKFDSLDAAIATMTDLLSKLEVEISGLQASVGADDTADIQARADKLTALIAGAQASLPPAAPATPTA